VCILCICCHFGVINYDDDNDDDDDDDDNSGLTFTLEEARGNSYTPVWLGHACDNNNDDEYANINININVTVSILGGHRGHIRPHIFDPSFSSSRLFPLNSPLYLAQI